MRSLTIHIPQPCPERWDDMQPAEQGRFCGSCQKTVIDYTAFSDQELVRLLSKVPEASCGRFHNEQLNRLLTDTKPDAALVWYRWVGVLSMSLFGWQSAQAQQKQVASVAVHEPAERVRFEVDAIPARTSTDVDTEWTVSGRVVSMDSTGEVSPVPMANILISGLQTRSLGVPGVLHNTRTDSTGAFSLSVPTQTLLTKLTVLVSTKDNRRGKATFEVMPNTTSILLNDIVLYETLARQTITGGGICTVKPPTRWQKVKRKLFR